MAQKKTKRRKILEELKTVDRKQQLFMSPSDLVGGFKSHCKQERVPISKVAEALIRDHLG